MFITHRARLAQMAAKSRLPIMYGSRELVNDGGLMSDGAKLSDNFYRAVTYVDRILKGARPADMPIERPATFQLIINVRTARALGLTISQSVLARADQVID